MTARRWTSVAIAGTLAVAVVGLGVAWRLSSAGKSDQASRPDQPAMSPMRALAEGIRQGDPAALTALCKQVLANADQAKDKARPAVGEEEGADLVEVMNALRAGFVKFNPVGRASAVSAATHLFDRFRVEPAPAVWFEALKPVQELVLGSLADSNVDVRSSALNEVGSHWSWLPGRVMTPFEEDTLGAWKESFYEPAKRCLSDLEPKSRAAAIVCLGALPIDEKAAPAVANVEYPDNGGVRYRTLMAFANRPSLLSVDTILKRLHDTEPGIPELAELILKGRGLSKEQIFLGRQIFNPHPEVRGSVIPLIRDRTDIDPVVWLLQLSHDSDETVRTQAVEALVNRDSPEVDRRLKEIGSTDSSAQVRAAAGKHVSKSAVETTALPPLPGSSSLNPKAN
jgi:HEAT repeats